MMTDSNSKVSCEIVQDLFPNYIEELCNDKTKETVNEHLSECEGCRDLLEDYVSDLDENNLSKKCESDFDLKDSISRKIVAKITAKNYFTVLVIVLLLFSTGTYRFFLAVGSEVSLTPERALYKLGYVSDNAEIIHQQKIGRQRLIVYEDGPRHGAVLAKRDLGIFWIAHGGLRQILVGTPFERIILYSNNKELRTTVMVVKTNDPSVQYIVFDKDCSEGLNQYVELEKILTKDRYIVVEIDEDGYGYYIDEGHMEYYNILNMGIITKEGNYIPQSQYRFIRGERP